MLPLNHLHPGEGACLPYKKLRSRKLPVGLRDDWWCEEVMVFVYWPVICLKAKAEALSQSHRGSIYLVGTTTFLTGATMESHVSRMDKGKPA